MMEQIFINVYARVDYLPLVCRNLIALDVRREIPFAKTTANPSEFVDKLLAPVQQRVGSGGVVQIANLCYNFSAYIVLQALFGDDVMIFVAANNIDLRTYFYGSMR